MTASVSASCASSTAANALKRSISPTAAAAAAASIHSKKLNQTYSRFSYITASPTNTKMPETYNSSSSSSSSSSSNITLYPQSHDLPSNSIKIVSWNVAGLKAALGKGFRPYIQAEDADIVCLQETKLNPGNDLQTGVFDKKVYPFQYWNHCKVKKGYSGTCLVSKTKPLNVQYTFGGQYDNEGRVILAEYPNFHLIACYIPNAGQKLERLDTKLEYNLKLGAHLRELEAKGKPVIWAGDLNVAPEPEDCTNFGPNKKIPGLTPQERANFQTLLKTPTTAPPLIDTFRHWNPTAKIYSFFGFRQECRAKNIGWRLDYFVVSEILMDKGRVLDSIIRRECWGASDHVPLVLVLKNEPIVMEVV